MAKEPADQHNQDFTSLTDAIIPSDIYLSAWNQPGQARQSENQPFSFKFDTSAPAFSSSSSSTANPPPVLDKITANQTALIFNSLHQLEPITSLKNKRVGYALNPRQETDVLQASMIRSLTGQKPHTEAASPHTETLEGNVGTGSTMDPLANLKLRAKESVMAKRAQSIRSPSSESKSSLTDIPASEPSPNMGSKLMSDKSAEISASDLKSFPSIATLQSSFVGSRLPFLGIHKASAKVPSLGLEDLIAEGRAAAKLPNVSHNQVISSAEQKETSGTSTTHFERQTPYIGDRQPRHSGQHGAREEHEHAQEITEEREKMEEVTSSHAVRHTEQAPVDVDQMDEINVWLEMTGYYDQDYREKVLHRHKRLHEIEKEKLKLLEEEKQLMGQVHDSTPFHGSQRPIASANVARPASAISKKDVGVCTKDVAAKTKAAPFEANLSSTAPVKRPIEDETTGSESPHQSKLARTEPSRETHLRLQGASLERRHDRSLSPTGSKKNVLAAVTYRSPNHRDNHWLGHKEVNERGAAGGSVEYDMLNRDHATRNERRRDSAISTSLSPLEDAPSGRVRFFLLKSWNYENIATAQKECTWATQTKNEDIFVEAFKTCRHVIFFFSANHSKAFQGYARMQGLPGEKGVKQPSWVRNLHWPTTAPFKLKWFVREQTPYRAVGNIKNPLNENLAIFVGRDGQEIPEKLGRQLCDIIDEDVAYRSDFRR